MVSVDSGKTLGPLDLPHHSTYTETFAVSQHPPTAMPHDVAGLVVFLMVVPFV
jgi:hypothetical protein